MTKVTIELKNGSWEICIYEANQDDCSYSDSFESLTDCLSYLADVRNYIKNFRKG